MKTYSSIRDFVADDQPPEPARTPAEERAGVALPGDPVEDIGNPYVGRSPQRLLCLLRSGGLPPEQEAQIRQAVSVFEAVSGENLTGGPERAMPIPVLKDDDAPSRGVDPDVAASPDYDPELADLFR